MVCFSFEITFDTRNQFLLHSHDQVLDIVYMVSLHSEIIVCFDTTPFLVYSRDTTEESKRHLEFERAFV